MTIGTVGDLQKILSALPDHRSIRIRAVPENGRYLAVALEIIEDVMGHPTVKTSYLFE